MICGKNKTLTGVQETALAWAEAVTELGPKAATGRSVSSVGVLCWAHARAPNRGQCIYHLDHAYLVEVLFGFRGR